MIWRIILCWLLGASFACADLPRSAFALITDADGVVVTRVYDALNRVINSTWPDASQKQFQYATNGLITYTNQAGQVTRFVRDGAGRVINVTDPLLQKTQFGYNALDEITVLTNGLNNYTTWTYNQFGWMTNKSVQGVNAITNAYDANGQLTQRWRPVGESTFFSYDAAGNRTKVTNGVRAHAYAYDADQRLTNILDTNGADFLVTSFTYTGTGELSTETNPWATGTLAYLYSQGRRTNLSLSQPSGAWSVAYAYDAAWRMQSLGSPAGAFTYTAGGASAASALISQIALPNGASIANHYDLLARLTNTALLNQWGHVLDGYGYTNDLLGRRTNITRQLGLTTNTIAVGYDGIGELTNWSGKEVGGALRQNEQLAYVYDAAGNLHYRTNGLLAQTFTVDASNQLSSVARTGAFTETGATPTPATSVTVNGIAAERYGDFTFARTNLTLANGNNTFTTIAQNTYGVNVTNTLTLNLPTTVNFQYDADGNLTNDGTRSFEYDVEDQLTNVYTAAHWRSSFFYDGLGRRRIERDYSWSGSAWTLTNETRYIYDGMEVVQERDGNNSPTVSYTRGLDMSLTLVGAGGIGGLLARTDATSTAYYHSDGSGNVTALMDGSQNVVARYEYDGFGKLIGKWGTLADVNHYRFSSKEINGNSGLYYYGYRFYEPNLQRWLNRDPIGENGGINLYVAFANAPGDIIDRNGLDNMFNPAGGENAPPSLTLTTAANGQGPASINYSPSTGDPFLLMMQSMAAGGLTSLALNNPNATLIAAQLLLDHGSDSLIGGTAPYKTDFGPPHMRPNLDHNNSIEDTLNRAKCAGATDLRKNRVQRDASGKRVYDADGRFTRPDAAWIDPNGRRVNLNRISSYDAMEREIEAFMKMIESDPAAMNILEF